MLPERTWKPTKKKTFFGISFNCLFPVGLCPKWAPASTLQDSVPLGPSLFSFLSVSPSGLQDLLANPPGSHLGSSRSLLNQANCSGVTDTGVGRESWTLEDFAGCEVCRLCVLVLWEGALSVLLVLSPGLAPCIRSCIPIWATCGFHWKKKMARWRHGGRRKLTGYYLQGDVLPNLLYYC